MVFSSVEERVRALFYNQGAFMSNINIYLRDNLNLVSKKNIFVAPSIDEKKLNNAIKSFGYQGSPSNVVALFDTTLFGSGKDGLLFTGEQVIYRASFSEPVSIFYESIVNAAYVEKLVGDKKDKLEVSVEISRSDENNLLLKNLLDCDYKKLADILQSVACDFDDYKEEKQLISIDEMSELLKISYVKSIINMAYDNDGIIDEKEFAEILLLMTRLDLSADSRFNLRAYMASPENIVSLEVLIAEINAECPEGQIKSLHISLVKDFINLYFCTDGSSIDEFSYLQKNRHILQVTDGDVELAVMAITNDHNMLKDDFTDDQVVTALKVLTAKAAAVGTPLAA